MKTSSLSRLPALILTGLMLCLPALAAAQTNPVAESAPAAELTTTEGGKGEVQPVLVVSLASLQKITKDLRFLTRSADISDLGVIAEVMLQTFTQGMDTSRPAGLYATMEGAEARTVGFLPVSDFETVREQIEERIGDLVDVGGGVLRLSMEDRDLFMKPQEGWVFASDNAANLAGTPKDPSRLLVGLHDKYDLAMRLNVGNVPEEIRDLIVTQMKMGFERGFDQGLEGDGEQLELLNDLGKNAIDGYVMLVEEADQVTVGWAVDPAARQTYVDLSVTAREGTKLADQMGLLKNATNGFGGFKMPNAAASVVTSSRMGPREIEQAAAMLNVSRERLMTQIDQAQDIPNEEVRGTVKEIVGGLMDVVDKTLAGGKVEGGAVLLLGPGSFKFAAGGMVADGKAVENSFRKLVDLAKDEPEFPEVKFNADSYKGVTFHTMNMPVPAEEEEARKLIGEKLNVALGVGDKSFYMAMGDGSVALLKQVLDGSASDADKAVEPFRMTVAVGPILKFANSVEDNPLLSLITDSLEDVQGRDQIVVTASSIDRGANYRVNLDGGVLKLVGKAVKIMTGQQQGNFGQDF